MRIQWGREACRGVGGMRRVWIWGQVGPSGHRFLRKLGQVPMRRYEDVAFRGY